MTSRIELLSIVIPVYNEAKSIPLLQEEIERVLDGRNYEILFVDDGSTDDTHAVIRRDTSVQIFRFASNRGQSLALHEGVRQAKGDVLILLDGDLQYDLHDIGRFLDEIEKGADLVCGYRQQRKDSLGKRISSYLANTIRRKFLDDGVRDSGCTFKAMRAHCIGALPALKGMHRFIPAYIKARGYQVTEIPVTHRPRQFGKSNYGFFDRLLTATQDMLGTRWMISRQDSHAEGIRTFPAEGQQRRDPRNSASEPP